MDRVISTFYEKVLKPRLLTNQDRYRNALFFMLTSQTSC